MIRRAEGALECEPKVPGTVKWRAKSLINSVRKVVENSKGPSYEITDFRDVCVWLVRKLGPKRSIIRKVIAVVDERVVNFHFETLACPSSDAGQHEAYVQLNVDGAVAYFICENDHCRKKFTTDDDCSIVNIFDFVIPEDYRGGLEYLVDEKDLQDIGARCIQKGSMSRMVPTRNERWDVVIYNDGKPVFDPRNRASMCFFSDPGESLGEFSDVYENAGSLFSLDGKRFSNADIENFYSIVKNWLLRGEGKERANRVLATVEDYNAAKSILLCRNIPKEGLAGRVKKAKIGTEKRPVIDYSDVEESDPDEPKTDEDETEETEGQTRTHKRKVPIVEAENDDVVDEKENCNKKQLPMDVDFEDVYNPDSRETWMPKKRRRQNKYVGRPFPKYTMPSQHCGSKRDKVEKVEDDQTKQGSRRSMEAAKVRRSREFSGLQNKEETVEDFFINFCDEDVKVVKHISYYEQLEDESFTDKLCPNSGRYPITSHQLLQLTKPRITNKGIVRKPLISDLHWYDFRRLRISTETNNYRELWLSTGLVDTVLSVFARQLYQSFSESVRIFDCKTAKKIVEGQYNQNDVENNKLDDKIQFIMLPFINSGDHFCLLIAEVHPQNDRTSSQYWYLDPKGTRSGYPVPTTAMRRNWVRFILEVSGKNIKQEPAFERITMEVPTQDEKDNFNCGIYVIFYSQCFETKSGFVSLSESIEH
ncbi:unnamed protein product [Bemisia tabaci]|uniref:Ubiquitin-like protease family profile domain-containing protein n=1 Tax=Bemisia tabaci TaxID=7038 RepID=A0A9P0AES4_BEMTA|nr:unnamed protein product [Bemisia tabaci]